MPNLSQYREQLNEDGQEVLLNVFTTWELSFQRLRKMKGDDCVELQLLTALAFFSGHSVHENILQELRPVSLA